MAKKKGKTTRKTKAIPTTDREWEVRNAADTLVKANEIKADKPMMRSVNAELKKRQRAIAKAIKE